MSDRYLPKLLGPVLHRPRSQVQVGVEADRSVVLDGLSDDEVGALRLLDGTRPLPAVLATPSGRELVGLLTDRGLLVDAGHPRALPPPVRALLDDDLQALLRVTTPAGRGYAVQGARRSALVLVAGRGALPTAVAATLRRCGVGRVLVGAVSSDDWEHRVRDVRHSGDGRPAEVPDLVVQTARHALDPRLCEPWRRHGTPLLPVVLGSTEAVVGPLVHPGLAPHGPCPACLDHTRTDLDPAWPVLLEQLTRPGVGPGAEVGGEESLVAMAAAMTAMVGLGALDGQPLPAGRSLEVGLPWPGVRQRTWTRHPRCGCAPAAGVSREARDGGHGDTSGRPADGQRPARVRMAG